MYFAGVDVLLLYVGGAAINSACRFHHFGAPRRAPILAGSTHAAGCAAGPRAWLRIGGVRLLWWPARGLAEQLRRLSPAVHAYAPPAGWSSLRVSAEPEPVAAEPAEPPAAGRAAADDTAAADRSAACDD